MSKIIELLLRLLKIFTPTPSEKEKAARTEADEKIERDRRSGRPQGGFFEDKNGH